MKLISPGKLRDVPESTEQRAWSRQHGAGSRKPQLWPEPEPEQSRAERVERRSASTTASFEAQLIVFGDLMAACAEESVCVCERLCVCLCVCVWARDRRLCVCVCVRAVNEFIPWATFYGII